MKGCVYVLMDQLVEIIVQALDDLEDEYGSVELSEPYDEVSLYGERGSLDSLGLVALTIDLEERILLQLGQTILIVSEKAVSRKVSPFLTIGSLAVYLQQVIMEEQYVQDSSN